MEFSTTYRLLRHARSGELWAIRIEHQSCTGVIGPLPAGALATDLAAFDYDDDRDDLEWISRYYEEFEVIGAA